MVQRPLNVADTGRTGLPLPGEMGDRADMGLVTSSEGETEPTVAFREVETGK